MPKDFPEVPKITLKQPIFGEAPSCNEWENNGDKWVKIGAHPIEKCHGILGVSVDEYVELQNFVDKAKQWAKDHAK